VTSPSLTSSSLLQATSSRLSSSTLQFLCHGNCLPPLLLLLLPAALTSPGPSYSSTVFDSKTSVNSFALSATPDSVQGYGEVNLLSAIPATSSDSSAQDLYVMDALAVVGKTNYILELNVANNDKPLKVTIVS
jgi:hypothetical protein